MDAINASLAERKKETNKCKTFEDRQLELQADLDRINAEIAARKAANEGNVAE